MKLAQSVDCLPVLRSSGNSAGGERVPVLQERRLRVNVSPGLPRTMLPRDSDGVWVDCSLLALELRKFHGAGQALRSPPNGTSWPRRTGQFPSLTERLRWLMEAWFGVLTREPLTALPSSRHGNFTRLNQACSAPKVVAAHRSRSVAF